MKGQVTTGDTGLDAGNPDNANGEEGVIYIGRNVNNGAILAGLFKWPTPIIDCDFRATLTIVPAYKALQNGPCEIRLWVCSAGDFDELAATWNNRTPREFGIPTDSIIIDGPDDQPISIDVTQQIWTVFGQGLSPLVLVALPATDVHSCVAIYSKDSGTHPEWGPRLTVLHG